LRDYELTVIVNPQVDEEYLKATVDKISRWITDKGGNISQFEPQGKRKLAYPIKKFMEGNYLLAKFQSDAKATKEIETNLKMAEDVLRYLLIKVGE